MHVDTVILGCDCISLVIFSVSDALSNSGSLASFSVCTLLKSLSGDFASLANFFDRFLSANTH